MTVGELIQALSRFNPNLRCVTGGFDEAGVSDISTVRNCKILFDARDCRHSHIGEHEESEDGVDAVWIDF